MAQQIGLEHCYLRENKKAILKYAPAWAILKIAIVSQFWVLDIEYYLIKNVLYAKSFPNRPPVDFAMQPKTQSQSGLST